MTWEELHVMDARAVDEALKGLSPCCWNADATRSWELTMRLCQQAGISVHAPLAHEAAWRVSWRDRAFVAIDTEATLRLAICKLALWAARCAAEDEQQAGTEERPLWTLRLPS